MRTHKPLYRAGLATMTGAFCFIITGDLVAQQKIQGEQNAVKLRPKAPIQERMDFLQGQGQVLMIPKKSLIYVPDWLQDKVITHGKTNGKIVRLDRFLAENSNWLGTYPVSFELALGKKRFTQEQLERLKSENKIMIATHGKAPIGISAKAWLSDETNNLNKP